MANKLSLKEATEKLKEILDQTDDDTRAFVIIYHEKPDSTMATDIEFFGAGCAACSFNVILAMAIKNAFVHNGPDPTSGLSKH
jgi:hypothetical protein